MNFRPSGLSLALGEMAYTATRGRARGDSAAAACRSSTRTSCSRSSSCAILVQRRRHPRAGRRRRRCAGARQGHAAVRRAARHPGHRAQGVALLGQARRSRTSSAPAPLGAYNMAYNLADIPAIQVGEQIALVLMPSMAELPPERRAARARALDRAAVADHLPARDRARARRVSADRAASCRTTSGRRSRRCSTVLACLSVFRPITWVLSAYLEAESKTGPADVPRDREGRSAARRHRAARSRTACAPRRARSASRSASPRSPASRWSCARARRRRGSLVGFLQPLAACVVMAVAVWLTQLRAWSALGLDHPAILLVVEIVVGAIAYVAAALVLAPRDLARSAAAGHAARSAADADQLALLRYWSSAAPERSMAHRVRRARAARTRWNRAGTEAALSLYRKRRRHAMSTHDLTVRFLGVRGSIATPGRGPDRRRQHRVRRGLRRRHADHPRRRHRPAHARRRAHGAGHPRTRRSCSRTCTGITSPGLPFFTPIYVPGHRVEIASGPNGVMPLDDGDPLAVPRAVLPGRLRRARRHGHDARAARERSVHDRRHHRSRWRRLNHPDPVYGFRLEHGGQSIVYATDTEHFACVDPTLKKLAAGADILIYDAQYTPEEYPTQGRLGPLDVAGGRRARARGRRAAARAVPPRSRVAPTRSSRRSRREARAAPAGHGRRARGHDPVVRAMRRRPPRHDRSRSCDAGRAGPDERARAALRAPGRSRRDDRGRGRARRPARDVRRPRRARARRRSRHAVADRRRDRRDPLARRDAARARPSCACRSGHGVVGHVARPASSSTSATPQRDPRWAEDDRAADRLPHDVDADRADRRGAARSAACSRCSTSATARSRTRDEEFVARARRADRPRARLHHAARRRRSARPHRARPLQPRDRHARRRWPRSTR